MRRAIAVTSYLLMTSLLAAAMPQPRMRTADRIRIAEAYTIAQAYGNTIWNGYTGVPFALDLVTDSVEFLIHLPAPTNEFTYLTYDSLLHSKVYYRPAKFNKHLLATFPAFNLVNTIVVGTPENTGRNSTDWIITLLHEHFHQYTYQSPDYYAAVDSLQLSGGDKTGMWMLNYPFPYSDSAVSARFKTFMTVLAECLNDSSAGSFNADLKRYMDARENLHRLLKPADYRYLSFQIWQEGIARYTEYKFLQLLGNYTPSKEVAALSDFIPFGQYKDEFYRKQLHLLQTDDLSYNKRGCFYTIGFAEGLLLDRINPSWRDQYRTQRFFIEKYFPH